MTLALFCKHCKNKGKLQMILAQRKVAVQCSKCSKIGPLSESKSTAIQAWNKEQKEETYVQ